MARKVVVTMVDDYDGRSSAHETLAFSLDGASYEIDLSVLNGSRLRDIFEKWTPHARKVGRVPKAKSNSAASPNDDRVQSAAVRKWARENGHRVSDRGRISTEIVSAYITAVS
ncbi:Lsr2 family protein [Nocardia sp. NBC_01377]|uniref:histone-like nucleoid-structuring protein Lsr2 n=1 Tax=Nocardia sp. NBC_01377 TaxID=2903595 RepID=UPI0032481E39